MGLSTVDIINILQYASSCGIKGKSLCMMGKQDLYMDIRNIPSIASQFGFQYDKKIYERIKTQQHTDSYDFFKMFGFSEVHAVDYSSYEGADIVFDLTSDLPKNLYHCFDYVVDGGTLEHTFDPAKSIKNMSNMVKNGGLIFHILPAVGWVNHGFYSFSPNMFLEFYHANGFQVRDLKLFFMPVTSFSKSKTFILSTDCRLISEDINEYIANMYKIGYKTALVCCIAEKMKPTDSSIYPVQGIYLEEYEKHEKSNKNWKTSAVEFLKSQSEKQIAFYSKGDYCDQLLNELFKNNLEGCVKCIFDSNPQLAGTIYRGYPVLYPTKEKLDRADIILIANLRYEDEIYSILSQFGTGITDKVYKISQMP